MRADLPTGTVTFLFTDIEGSTRLLHQRGPAGYADALGEHRAVLRKAFTSYGGVEVDTQGDAFFVAFPTAEGAAAAALAGQQALKEGPIAVRMGLHTGAPTLTDEGYVGVDVHRGARVGALAHGGQVVLTAATAALLDGASLLDLGAHRLKDFDGATRLHQLGHEAHPPLRTPGTVQLPTPSTPFLGREQELFAAVSVVLEQDPHLLTVLGPGGTGKTRFSIELARLLAEGADGGTAFVPLAALRDATLVLPAIAEALGAGGADAAAIAGRVGSKRTHLVLDNLEQLLPGAAPALAELLRACPELRLIITSREALRIAAETEFDLPPLTQDEAVALFLATASRVRSGLERTPATDALCARLDRLPLALELAAARVKLFTPDALLERLGSRLDLLRGGRDADPRHATLTATIAWSYDLLDADEKRVFARLAVFQGGCKLEAAEAVCDADVDVIASLIDKSLLRRRTDADGEDRFWMLETIREFATARLADGGEEAALRERQLDVLAALADLAATREDADAATPRPQDLDAVAVELDNIRAVLEWAVQRTPVRGLQLASALTGFWVIREPLEGTAWLSRLLTAAPDAPPVLQGHAYRDLGGTYDIFGRHEEAAGYYRRSLELFEGLEDEHEAANVRFRIANNLVNQGKHEEAALGAAQSLADFEELGMQRGVAQSLGALAHIAFRRGDIDRAADLLERSARLAEELEWSWWWLHQIGSLAECDQLRGRYEESTRRAMSGLQLAVSLGDRMGAVFLAAQIARNAAETADAGLAGRLWGAILAEEQVGPIGQWPSHRAEYERSLRQVSGPEFERGVEQGRLLSLLEAASPVA